MCRFHPNILLRILILKMKNTFESINGFTDISEIHKNNYLGISASKENKEFLSIISHNIKNPFATLLGFSDLLFEDYNELSDEDRKFYLEEIIKSANFTNKYLERFFEWIYYKTGKVNIILEEVNLIDTIEQSIKMINQKLNFQNISFIKDSALKVKADSDSLVKILFYVIENSVIHSETSNNIEITYLVDGNDVDIRINDKGKGIPKDQLSKMFKVNEDISLSSKSKNRGTGLGLILTKQLLDLNNGKILIASELNMGTEVSIKLPLFQKAN